MTLHRRSLLQSTGAGVLLAPFVPRLYRSARAASPARLIVFYSSNGTVHEKWLPTMSGGTLVLSDILKPLEPYKADLLAVDGLNYVGGWNGHELGMVLTGSRPKIAESNQNWGTTISVDQAVANAIGAGTRIRSIQAGIQVDAYARWVAALSYTAPLQPMIPENSPLKIFDRVFAGVMPPTGGDTAKLEQRLLDQRSIIDFVLGDLAALRPKLGTEEQKKVDAHLQHVREMEMKLSSTAVVPACRVPTRPSLDFMANDNIPAVGRVQMDLLVTAMACDLTRVGTIQYGRGGANHRLSWLGADLGDNSDIKGDGTTGIHGLAHNETNLAARAKLVRCHGWYAGELAYLYGRLKAIPEPGGTGTMADNTLIMWVNELATGNHGLNNVPFVLLGSLGGRLRTGRVVSFPGQSHAKLLVNVCQAMGLPSTTFGDPTLGNAPLPGLLA